MLQPTSSPEGTTKRSFADTALGEGSASPPQVDLRWVPPTSNDVERLFSRAGIVFSRLRRSLNPMTLETVMFLQYNRASGMLVPLLKLLRMVGRNNDWLSCRQE
ncbi:hypothetical protein PHYPSEUDO_014673 [Phytophthora pseudosyringae]|uniref:HAT C-terminal dimerisation domain-containing protein n=1 Tax=Phytophthora pseudosyringae TaxID=221518 RepID=A0A8T1W4V2_9STRA|nr:hypothetical protein PHYPSEUDO_014673 [Phytophthora pseudosyringae]